MAILNVRTDATSHHRHNPQVVAGQAYVEYSHLGTLGGWQEHVDGTVLHLEANPECVGLNQAELKEVVKNGLRQFGRVGLPVEAGVCSKKIRAKAEAIVLATLPEIVPALRTKKTAVATK
jgi:hypothetical protein